MASESLHPKMKNEFKFFTQQASNFEDACAPDDIKSITNNRRTSIPKVSSWNSFLHIQSSDATPNDTPQSSPMNNRKEVDTTNKTCPVSSFQLKTSWFNGHLFAPFHDKGSKSNFIVKSNSYRNVSNFDLNAIGPTSF